MRLESYIIRGVIKIKTLENSLASYNETLKQALDSTSEIEIVKAVELLRMTALNGNMIYVCGNGGSASIANTLAAVWMKWVNQNTSETFRAKVVSLACNSSLTTAISNDIGYDEVFAYQLSTFLEPGDIVVTVSSSGNSPNIRRAIEVCKGLNNDCIAFSGFNGGFSKLANINIHVNSHEYCIVEDAHHALCHHITRRIIHDQHQFEGTLHD